MKKVAIGCDEWYPWLSVDDYDKRFHSGEWYAVLTISDEDYLVYMGLQEQIERLQTKLGKLYDKNRAKTHQNRLQAVKSI